MTEAVQNPEVPEEVRFLGLTRGQFATVLTLSSVQKRLPEMLANPELKVIMDELRNDPSNGKLREALYWTCDQRNALLQLSHTVSFALNLIVQVEDQLIMGAFKDQETK